MEQIERKAVFHLPGLFEFYDFYCKFLPLYTEHREYFYSWCEIGSIYGAPSDCLWGGGRAGYGNEDEKKVLALMEKFGISSRLTFSNSLLKPEHLDDKKCNRLCSLFEKNGSVANGIIVHSDLLLDYIREKYPDFYFVSSTTKVITDFKGLINELNRSEFSYVVSDFRLNVQTASFQCLLQEQKAKIELLCNECCWFECRQRKECYENVSKKNLGLECREHQCHSPKAEGGYVFSDAMENPGFIGLNEIKNIFLPMGINNFKIEGRSLGSAIILEFLLYYMIKPEYQLKVREWMYLDSSLDLF